jgi:ParB-like chromosome segregation protein Spo0J
MSTETLTYRGRTYRRHPLSALFPIIVGEEFESLKASIHENGLRQAILLAAEGGDEVLDGWNRLRGCIETDSEARFEYAAADADLITISLDLNLSRRHLTAGQKAMIAAEIANMPKGYGGRFSESLDSIKPRGSTPSVDDANPNISSELVIGNAGRLVFIGFQPD